MTAKLFTLYRPLIGKRYQDVVVSTGQAGTVYQARLLFTLNKLEEGAGYNAYSYMTQDGQVLCVRRYYQIGGWDQTAHPDTWGTLPIADLVKASARGRITSAIMGSPYDLLYNSMRSLFPPDKENQLRCAALCRITLKELGIKL